MGVGAAATTGNRTKSASLLEFRSIFTVEKHTINLSLIAISATKESTCLYSQTQEATYKCFKSKVPTNPKVRKLKDTVANLQKSEKKKTLELRWIPGHAGSQETKSQIKKNKKH